MSKKFWIPIASGITALALVGSLGVANAVDKNDVTVVVDGEPYTISVREDTVAEVLELEGLSIGEHDMVLPGPDSKVSHEMEIVVSYGRPLEVTVDGETREVWTTAQTVGEALGYLDLEASDSKYSASRSTAIGREGLTLDVATAKDVTLTVAGAPSQLSVAGTVADALAAASVVPDADDQVTPAPETVLTDGLQITYVEVTQAPRQAMVTIPFEKQEVKSSKLLKGKSEVSTKGVEGAFRQTWTDTFADGVLVDSEMVEQVVSVQPVHQVTVIGTKVPEPVAVSADTSADTSAGSSTASSSGHALNLAREAMWDRIARCESTNRWNINTGNGYYGGLQFNLQTWRSVNGQDFAAYPHQATRAEQITVANRLYAKRGTQPWSCA